ncbi:helix-turn-helix domain-containing protein [Oceanobacillus bengalensis]|nr:helix-turn-helix transcriptional regulator [Oceanobacillus bengalensis]
METLGERIRKMRKEKKMTLEELAGERISKSMLSLIENNKAQPSMESLTFISEQLGVGVGELMQQGDKKEIRKLLKQAEVLYHSESEIYVQDQLVRKFTKVVEHIRPYLNQLEDGYESARLLQLYSYSLFYSNQDGWQDTLKHAANIYEKINATSKRASIGIFQATVLFSKNKYSSALQVLLQEKEKIEQKEPYIDPLIKLDFDYSEAVYRLAIGDTDVAMQVIENAIQYSKTHKIFYHIDDLFRIAAGYGLLFHDEEKISYYTNKLKHYGEFVDDPFYHAFADFIAAERMIFKEQNFSGALDRIEKHLNEVSIETLDPHFIIVKGKCLYELGHYEEAIHWLNKVNVPYYLHHPYDLSLLYIGDSYKALCHLKLDNLEQALTFATLAKENFEPILDSFYKEFAYRTYRQVVEAIKKEKKIP